MRGQSQQTTTSLTNEVKEQIADAMNCQTRGVAGRLQGDRAACRTASASGSATVGKIDEAKTCT